MSKPSKQTQPRNHNELAESRIITKNLVYVIGLSSNLANKDILIKTEYFGQYGTITKIVVNRSKAYNQNNPNGPSYSAYVTFSKPYEASIAILSLDNSYIDNHLIRASFGTTKFCTFYLKKIECVNKDCLFLHRPAQSDDIISKEELNSNKNIFVEQQQYAIKIADIYNKSIRRNLMEMNRITTVFPPPYLIYELEIVIENDPGRKRYSEDLDKGKHMINRLENKSERSLNETTSTSSREDISYTNNEDKTPNTRTKINEFKLFTNKESSRFEFCKATTNQHSDQLVDIPEFIQKLVIKKAATHKFTKYMQTMDDILYQDKTICLENEKKNHWAQFLIENKANINTHKQDDKRLIDDFDNINEFIHNIVSYK